MKKLGAVLLSLFLCLSLLPVTALAVEGDTGTPSTDSTSPTDPTTPPTKKSVTIKVSKSGSLVQVSVQDENGETPENLKLELTVDGKHIEDKETHGNKNILFDYELKTGDTKIVVSSKEQGEYQAAEGSMTLKYTPEEMLGFVFEESSRNFDGDTGAFTMNWNYFANGNAKGWDITALIIDDKRIEAEGGMGRVRANILDLPHGPHTLSYVFSASGQEDITIAAAKLVRTGTVKTTLKLSVSNKKITATVTDAWDRPVADVPVILTVGSTNYAPQKTNSKGVIVFNADVSAGGTVQARTEAVNADGVTYEAASASLQVNPGESSTTTTTTGSKSGTTSTKSTSSKTSSTTENTETPTTGKTYATITGVGTTSIEKDRVVLNASFDTGVADAFQLKNSDFEGKARFLLSKGAYAGIVGDTNGVLMMSVRYSPIQVTDQQISTVIANQSKFSPYHAENIQRVTVNLSLLFKSNGSEAQMTSLPEDSYTVQLPIPKEMKDTKLIAVAATNENGISTPVEATIENGYLRFDTKYLSNFTILGFSEAKSGSVSKIPTLVIVVFIVAGLLLVGAGLLFYFFVLRKPKDEEDGDDPTPPEGGGDDGDDGDMKVADPYTPPTRPTDVTIEDIFSGVERERQVREEPPMPIVPPSSPEMEDLYSSDSRRPPAAGPATPRSGGQTPPGGVSLDALQHREQQPPLKPAQPRKNPLDYDL